ncbi:MAG: polysaccharide deacetylase, partial [Gammaproteobacteria bacterium]|nr:polysaccharide deacetylase [Gammaproteobacteria bacterium]
ERAAFETLNTAYTEKHGFPFIIPVRDHTKSSILAAFEQRLDNSSDIEFDQACKAVERIAALRLQGLLP